MGNTCASEQSAMGVKASSATRPAPLRRIGAPPSTTSTQPPVAPRNIDGAHPIAASTQKLYGAESLIPIDWADEGGSPAIDMTKSQESVKEWLQEVDGSDVSESDIAMLAQDVNMDGEGDSIPERLANMWVLPPPPAHYDAEEDAKRRHPVVSSLSLETPKLPSLCKTGFSYF